MRAFRGRRADPRLDEGPPDAIRGLTGGPGAQRRGYFTGWRPSRLSSTILAVRAEAPEYLARARLPA